MSCPICGGKTFDLVATEIREGEGRIVSCAGCGLVMQDLAMGPAEIARYYNEEYQRTNSLVADIVQSAEEHFQERIDTVQALFEMIRPRLQPLDDVLEIGCGAGELLFCIKPLVRSCIGAEMNKAFVEYMRSTLSMEAYAGDFLQMGFDRTFDLIVMIDTLDRLPNPVDVLRRIRTLLKPGGVVWVTVPNRDEALNFYLPEPSLSAFRKFFWHKAHFFYYTRETIARLFEVVGMEAEVTCYHDYTLKNYLHWYFVGKPQGSYVVGTTDRDFFTGFDPFEFEMGTVLRDAEAQFRAIMKSTFRGDTLSCLATPRTQ